MLTSTLSDITNHDLLLLIVVVSLIVISLVMVYLVYSENRQLTKELKSKKDNTNKEMLELQKLSKILENAPKSNSKLTDFEAEQEEKAIISYDELLKNKDNVKIGYESTEVKDDIEVKKIDLDSTGKIELDPIKKELNTKISLVSYEHEEEFLDSLKQLQYLLNK